MPDPFEGPKLKIERAEAHIRDLQAAVAAFHQTDPYALVREEKGGKYHYRIRILQPVPTSFALLIGDAIQNLRTALDYAACCLAIQKNPAANVNDVSFPIGADLAKFKSSAKDKIRKLTPEARAFIEALKPYQGGNDAFWRLHRLAVRDRHRLLLTTWGRFRSVGVVMLSPHPTKEEKIKTPRVWLNPADHSPATEDGTDAFICPVAEIGSTIDEDIQVRVEIAFGDGEVVKSEPIDPTIFQLRDFVKDVILSIEKRFFP
ncbi:MAG: hypothetical protein Kow00114_01150 [Kiloniellaceae bacterium]